MKKARKIPAVLTIAGSDSSGGAGIQADMKTFCSLGVFGTTAITCLTAQNLAKVTSIEQVSPSMVVEQIMAVCEDFPIKAVKTGMLYSAEIIRAVAKAVRNLKLRPLVIDPVLVATSGARLLREDAIKSFCRELLPLAEIVTPNLPEAELLWGRKIKTKEDMCSAALCISRNYGIACVVKGGHLNGDKNICDVLVCKGKQHIFEVARVKISETHGTGCTYSAAIASFLALGDELSDAVRKAQKYVANALATAVKVGTHTPMGWGDVLGN